MKITIECTSEEQRNAAVIEAFIKGLTSDTVVQSGAPPKED